MSDTPISDATPHNVAELGMLVRRLERELNAANSKIELLMSANADVARIAGERDAAEKRIRLLIAERDTARLQADQKVSLREEFRELLGTDDIEQGITVVCDLKQLASVRLGYIKQLETEKEAANERIKRLEEAGDALENDNYTSDNLEAWRKAKESK